MAYIFTCCYPLFFSKPYKGIEETSLTVIDDVEKLNGLLEKLKAVKEVAIDLEVSCNFFGIER